jgi:hypothetical protein
MANKRVLGLLVGAVVLVLLAVLMFYPAQKKKTDPPTPQQATQNECAMGVYKDYLKDKIALSQPTPEVTNLLSVENTLAKRRLEERFCLQFAECLADPSKQTAAMVKDMSFSSCLKYEALEEYDAVPREDVPEGQTNEE